MNKEKDKKEETTIRIRKSSYSNSDENSSSENNEIICKNCEKEGHQIKRCKEPITSYGIICYYKINSRIYYLMINRKDTISFVDFVTGKYNPYNFNYLKKMFMNMCYEENYIIKMNNFEQLWDLCKVKNKNIYNRSKKKYNLLKKLIYNKSNLSYFDKLLLLKSKYKEPEWGFPKGRKTFDETKLQCAIREFSEETDIDVENINLLEDKIYIEQYKSINGVEYRTIFYLANAKYNMIPKINKKNKNQIKEVSKIEWNTYLQCIKKIRCYHVSRKNVIKEIEEYLRNQ